MSIKVLVFGMTDNPGGMESCVMNYYRNIDWSDVQFDFLCNWENMVYADEVTAKGSKIYTIPQKSKDYKAYKKALDDFFKAHKGEYDVFWYNTCTLTNIDYLVYAKKYGIKKRFYWERFYCLNGFYQRGITIYVGCGGLPKSREKSRPFY